MLLCVRLSLSLLFQVQQNLKWLVVRLRTLENPGQRRIPAFSLPSSSSLWAVFKDIWSLWQAPWMCGYTCCSAQHSHPELTPALAGNVPNDLKVMSSSMCLTTCYLWKWTIRTFKITFAAGVTPCPIPTNLWLRRKGNRRQIKDVWIF